MKFILCLLALVVSFNPWLAFSSSNNPKTVSAAIELGVVFSATGIAAPHNQPLAEMTRLAVRVLNDSGGLLGRPIKMKFYDNLSSPIGSSIAARKVVLDNISAVIGAHWSSHSIVMSEILQNARIPMLSPGSTNPEVTKGKSYIFRACFTDPFQGLTMAKFAYDELKTRSAVVVTNIDEDYSTTLGNYFSSAFTGKGGSVLKEMSYRGNATDFSHIIKKIVLLKPDAVYLPGYTRDSGFFIKQARKLNVKAVFLGGDAWDEIEKIAGEDVNGSYQSAAWHPQVPFAQSRKMQESYLSAYGKPIENMSSPLAYDAVMILAQAITRAGSTDSTALREALAKTDYRGATGHITFDHNGDPLNKAAIIIEFKDGKRVFKEVVAP